MEINRNQWFLAGMLLLLLGLQFRLLDSLVLTPQCTKLFAECTGHPITAVSDATQTLVGAETSIPPKNVEMPEWLGWALLSLGSVLVLHSLSMKRPE